MPVSVCFVYSHQMQCTSILMDQDSQKAAKERIVISMWSGGTMESSLTLEWREMEMVGLL